MIKTASAGREEADRPYRRMYKESVMQSIISNMEAALSIIAEIGAVLLNLFGVCILVYTGVQGFVRWFRRDRLMTLGLARGIAAALALRMGAELLRTIVIRQWREVGFLAAFAGIWIALMLAMRFLAGAGQEPEPQRESTPAREPRRRGAARTGSAQRAGRGGRRSARSAQRSQEPKEPLPESSDERGKESAPAKPARSAAKTSAFRPADQLNQQAREREAELIGAGSAKSRTARSRSSEELSEWERINLENPGEGPEPRG